VSSLPVQRGAPPPLGRSKLPKSLIPTEDHITVEQPVPPELTQQANSRFDKNRNAWVTTVFPQVQPAGRRNVELLDEWLAAKLQGLEEQLPAEASGRQVNKLPASPEGAETTATPSAEAKTNGPGESDKTSGGAQQATAGEASANALKLRLPPAEALGGQMLRRLAAVLQASADKGGDVRQADALAAAAESMQDTMTRDDEEVLATALFNTSVSMTTEDILRVIREAQRVYSIALHEIVRQVSVHCVERGQLLAKVWSSYMVLFDLMESVSEPLKDDVRLLRGKLIDQVHLRQQQEDFAEARAQEIDILHAKLQVRLAVV